MVNNQPWIHFTKGLVEYRQGNYQGAVDWMHKTLDEPLRHTDNRRYFSAYMVLAMAQYRLGQIEDAHASLARGIELEETQLPQLGSNDLGPMWQNLLHGNILMREARALIEGAPDGTAKTK